MKKRISALLLLCALLLCLPGCGKTEEGAFRPLEVVGTKHYGVICRKGDQIAPVIDAAMRVLAANGTLSAISFQNLGRSAVRLDGDAGALDALDREIPRRTLIVGVHTEYRPLAYTENGEEKGMSVDIARHLCSLLGWDLRLQPIAEDEIGTQLSSGNIDCAIGFDGALVRADKYEIGVSYMESSIVVAVRSESDVRSLRGLKGRHVGTVDDPVVQSALKASERLTKYAVGAYVYSSALRCVNAMDGDYCGAVVMDSLLLSYYSFN